MNIHPIHWISLLFREKCHYLVFSSPYFSTFGLNTEWYGVFSPNAEKYGPEKLQIWTLSKQWIVYCSVNYMQIPTLREKCPNTEFFLVRIFLYSDQIRDFTEYISVFSSNTGKYGPGKTLYLDTFDVFRRHRNVTLDSNGLTIHTGKTCALLNSLKKFIENQGWLLLRFFMCFHNQLISFNSIIVQMSEKLDSSNRLWK